MFIKSDVRETVAILMTITTEMWHERLSAWLSFFNPASKARRDSRKVMREVKMLLTKLEPATQKAEATHDATAFEKTSLKVDKMHETIALQLIDELVQVRLSLAKQLKLLSAAKVYLHRNKRISDAEKEKYTGEIEQCIASITAIINKLFQDLTSMSSINMSLKQDLHEDTLAQIIKGETINESKDLSKTAKQETKVERDAASGDQKDLSSDLKNLLDDIK
jgi:hypothetical protein